MGRLVLLVVFVLASCSETSGTGGGSGGGGSAGTGAAGTGGLPECSAPEECPAPPYAGNCQRATCVDGVCGAGRIREGEFCATPECNVDYGICNDGVCVATPRDDGTACTKDLEQCTADVCLAGVCEHAVLEDQTPCDEENVCTVMGACTEGECIATPLDDGTSCGDGAGACEAGRCSATFACTEAGIREAIALGGGPHTFECDGPTTVVIAEGFAIDRDVELDGEGQMTLDGVDLGGVSGTVFRVGRAIVTLRGFTVWRGAGGGDKSAGGTIENVGRLTLSDMTVSESRGWYAVLNGNELVVMRSSIVENPQATGVLAVGHKTTILSSTIAGNSVHDVLGVRPLAIFNSTVGVLHAGEQTELVSSTIARLEGRAEGVVVRGSVVKSCPPSPRSQRFVTSEGHNIEQSWDSCGFDQPTDQVNVTVDDLKLGPLQDNGGPTMTHALGAGSVAIDVIPADMCEVDEDQRGEPRDSMCDVGAFEVQEGSL
ncbi:MAG: hypothetical protein JRG93_13310 [Deltaproteobacteria bacterium]|nr:hypothetical protein [Deltaproteobacteria bacterium]MBW2402421.1 hypothetical protein [Deltaproteobacteria bacterium]MBW2545740.1 hypothetical protein [Deltaproteobacteria bacterium]